MKPLSPKTLIHLSTITHLPNSRISPIALLNFSKFPILSLQFHSSPHPSPPNSQRREDERRLVRVSVWWDFENCKIPANGQAFRVAQSITAAVRGKGIKGPIQITAFGDVLQMTRANQEGLSSTGITLTHIPRGGKNSSDRSLLVDLMCWVSQNPPPAHLFLISSDVDFANILHRLRLNNYNILLSSSDDAPAILRSAASIMWSWKALVRGENLCGKHFNQPPDGPYGSWYGHYTLPLEDPFVAPEKQASSRSEGSSESSRDLNVRPVPKVVVKEIRHILKSYPEGISITELHSKLGKTNVSLDKDFYGYKKFSCFILSNSHILRIQSCGQGEMSIRSIAPKALQLPEDATGKTSVAVPYKGNQDQVNLSKGNGRNSSCSQLEKKTLLHPYPKVQLQESSMKVEGSLNKVSDPSLLIEKENKFDVVREPPSKCQESPNQVEETLKKASHTSPLFEKANKSDVDGEPLKETQESHNQVEEPLEIVPDFSPVDKTNDSAVSGSHLSGTGKQGPESEGGFLKRIWRKWFGAKVGRSEGKISEKPDTYDTIVCENSCKSSESNGNKSSSGLSSDKPSLIDGADKEQHMFSTESFWKVMAEFVDSPEGSSLILLSKAREHMAYNLRKEGPSVLRNLTESDLLHLVHLLISDKKWVEEYPSKKLPFKLIGTAEKSSSSNSQKSSSLRSIFLNTQSQPNSTKLAEHKKMMNTNVSHAGVPPSTVHKNVSRSRDEILIDCRKLVENILKEYPSGFNMSGFRKLFVEKYGYPLDVKRLGYEKLVSLLQIMPRVKIESNHILPELPSGDLTSNSATGATITKSDGELDSRWAELGPVSPASPKMGDMKKSSNLKMEGEVQQESHKYESLTDEYFSGSDDDMSPPSGYTPAPRNKSGTKGKESSLLQILDSWDSIKEDHTGKALAEGYKKNHRPSTSYSFVSHNVVDDKSKLVDGILGNLKKSSETSPGKARIQA